MRLLGNGSVQMYQGVVEDRADPEKLGRVRVRVLGVHTEDVTLLPTKDLPWAVIASSPTNAGVSGLGWSPTGLVTGSWVFVQFADGDSLQIPIVVGTAYGINPTSKISTPQDSVTSVSTPDATQQAQGIVSGNTWTSGATKTSTASNTTPTPSDNLGSVSEKYESNGNPGSANKDPAKNKGYSYGCWQLNGATLSRYLMQTSYKSEFIGLAAGTPEFNTKWKSIAQRDSVAFKADQKAFINKTNYVPALGGLPFLQDRGPCVQNLIWSCAVQMGPSGAKSLINKALAGQDVTTLTNADICSLVKDYQSNNVRTLFKSSPGIWSSLQDRYAAEKKDLLAMCGDVVTVKAIPPVKDAYGQDIDPGEPKASIPKEDNDLNVGFIDPKGKWPKNGYLGKADTNRLARAEELQYTLLEFKNRTKVQGNGYAEPDSPYAAIYPNNKVYMSESGHVIEIDDTPKGERIHIWHKSGSYIEFQPDGTIVKKSYKDDHEIVLGEDKTYVTGNMNVFVEGNLSFKTLGNFSIEAEGNISITSAAGVSIGAAAALDLTANAGITQSTSGEIVQKAKKIRQSSGGSSSISVSIGAKLALLKDYSLEDTSNWLVDEPSTPKTKEQIQQETGITLDNGDPATSPQSTSVKPINPGSKIAIEDVSNPQLSEHFWLSDLTTGCIFSHKLVEQADLTREQLILNLQNVAVNVLEPLVTQYGKESFIITSGFRPVSGSGKSQHFTGEAVDVQFPGQTLVHIAHEASILIPVYDQMILEYHGNNPVLHTSYSAKRQRKDAFSTFTTGFHPITPKGFYDSNANLIYKV